MEELLGKFVMSYLLMPLIAVLLGSVMFFIAKKNQLLRNRKLIGYCIIYGNPVSCTGNSSFG